MSCSVPVIDEHAALDTALLLGEEIDVELARDAEAEHGIGFPDPAAVGPSTAAVSREMERPVR